MIGVIANPSDEPVVREFFELFKTPWEFCRDEKQYEVVLCTIGSDPARIRAKLVVLYLDLAKSPQFPKTEHSAPRVFQYRGRDLPIYGRSATFHSNETVLTDRQSRESAVNFEETGTSLVVRIGYDLFSEVRTLLMVGQPTEHAESPSLDLHIAILRDLIIERGISLVEIPPVPSGYQFIACLTHDVDHPSIRLHRFNHTMWGFVYRALLGSVVNLFAGRISFKNALRNWVAVLKLPFVYLGIANDVWSDFDQVYSRMERNLPSTFFVIPVNDPGATETGRAPHQRACRYSLSDIKPQIERLLATGHEIGTHGIDAWRDISAGQKEIKLVCDATGARTTGVRMHWLYSCAQTPATLESAGASYDSTVGYNEAIGYRAGTTQAYVPLNATRLIELPMHVMDTALFYPTYLNLPPIEALERVIKIFDNAALFGGVVTLNWHDRSTSPERHWGDVYSKLIDELMKRGAWFATATQSAEWFRKRRSVVFVESNGELRIQVDCKNGTILPAMNVRVHNPVFEKGQKRGEVSWVDAPLLNSTEALAIC